MANHRALLERNLSKVKGFAANNILMVTVSSGAFRTNTLLKNRFQLCSRGHTKKNFRQCA